MTPLEYAHRYANAGYRVHPLKPGTKHPATRHGFLDATTDPDLIDEWWRAWPDAGIGIALGAHPHHRYVFAVDIDDHGADGPAIWADLCDTYAWSEPDGIPEQITGGGGRHLLFSAPHTIRNGELGPDVQTRGEGGYIVVEPSTHPDTGQTYTWADGQAPWDIPPHPAPPWLLAHLEPPEREIRERVDDPNDTRPGSRWMRDTPWQSILEADGWTYAGSGRQVDAYWTRPGKQRGISASQGYNGSDVLKVFTSSVPFLEAERTYDKLGYIAARDHRGDIAAASKWAADQLEHTPADTFDPFTNLPAATPTNPDPDDTEGWPVGTPDQIAAIYAGDYTPPVPSLMQRNGGGALLYPGKVHSISGEPGSGKTWIALAAIAEVLADGGDAMLVDYEDRIDTAVRRLKSMGVPQCATTARFHYITPTIAYSDGLLPNNVVQLAARCAVVVTDSVGEALSHSGLNQNADDEVAAWMRNTARRLADGGAAIIMLDHVTKDTEHRGRFAIGSQRKLAAIDGIAYMTKTIKAASKDNQGIIRLNVSKDRGGHYPHGTDAAVIHITPNGDDNIVTIEQPHDHDDDTDEWLPTALMERVSQHLEAMPAGLSQRQILDQVAGGHTYIKQALGHLVRLGYVTRETGPRNAVIHKHSTPYRELEIGENSSTAAPRHDRGSTAASRGAQNPETDRGTAARPLGVPRSQSVDGSPTEHSTNDDRGTTSHNDQSEQPFDPLDF